MSVWRMCGLENPMRVCLISEAPENDISKKRIHSFKGKVFSIFALIPDDVKATPIQNTNSDLPQAFAPNIIPLPAAGCNMLSPNWSHNRGEEGFAPQPQP
jgi:hypothetical protein